MYAESKLPKKVRWLLTSAMYNDIIGVKRALKIVNVNSCGWDLVTAIHLVAEKGYTELAEFLVTVKGIKLNLSTAYGSTPLKLSVYHNHYEITIILLKAGADPNAISQYDMTPLHVASFHGRLQFVEALIEYKADVNVVDCFDRTPLFFAIASHPSESIAYLLLKAGAEPNYKSKSSFSLLHIASLTAHTMNEVYTVATLLYFGANINDTDLKQETALHKAALNGYPPLINLLVKNGANLYAENMWGQTPRYIALIHQNQGAVKILQELEHECTYQELVALLNISSESSDDDMKF